MNNIRLEESELPINEDEFLVFVEKFELKLPDDYKEFILINNGGYPKKSAYGNPYEGGFDIQVFYCLRLSTGNFLEDLEKLTNSANIIGNQEDTNTKIGKDFYPFGSDAGGNEFCISMRKEDLGFVYLYLTNAPRYITNSFKDFVASLEYPKPYES